MRNLTRSFLLAAAASVSAFAQQFTGPSTSQTPIATATAPNWTLTSLLSAGDTVPGLLAAMDMAILPSAGDYTSPVKLFEFMACAVPLYETTLMSSLPSSLSTSQPNCNNTEPPQAHFSAPGLARA